MPEPTGEAGSGRRSRGRTRNLRASAVVGVLLIAGCTTDDGTGLELPEVEVPDVEAPDISAPEIEAPEIEAPDIEAPAVEAPELEPPDVEAPAESGDDGLTAQEWFLLIVLGVGVIAVILGATSAATSHSAKKSRERSSRQRRVNDIVGGCRWIVDQGSTIVLTATDGAQAQQIWTSVRPHLLETEQRVARFGAGSGDHDLDDALSRLGLELAGLRSALDGYVSALVSSRQDLVDQARVTVNDRRRQVELAVQPVAQASR